MDFYPPAPYLGDGQRISAAAHLNALRLSTLFLLGEYQGARAAWAQNRGTPALLADGWRRAIDGYIRKKSDTLGYTFYVVRDSVATREIRIRYNDVELTPTITVAPGSGTATVSSTRSLSAHTDGQFYSLQVDIRNGTIDGDTLSVFHLAEQISPSWPSLHAFDTGVPTAAQWQALSSTADAIHDQMLAPRAMFPRTHLGRNAWVEATLRKRSQTLFYRINFRLPYRDDTRAFTMFLHLYINGVRLATVGGNDLIDGFVFAADTTIALKDGRYCAEGDVLKSETGELILLGAKAGSTFTGCTRGYQNTLAGDMGDTMMVALVKARIDAVEGWNWAYSGTVSLAGAGLTVDTDYTVAIYTESTSYLAGDEITGQAQVVCLAEQEDDIGLPAWWGEMPSWEHGETVDGADNVQRIRDNLAALALKANYYNQPSPKNGSYGGAFFRRHRWLHYYCAPPEPKTPDEKLTMKPTLIYYYNGRQEASLTYEANKWLKHDLDGVRGLWPGSYYELTDVSAAIEDEVA